MAKITVFRNKAEKELFDSIDVLGQYRENDLLMKSSEVFRAILAVHRTYQVFKTQENVELGFDTVPANSNIDFKLVNKQNRLYTFPNNQVISVNHVISVNVSKSGGHRLNTKDPITLIPGFVYVPAGWLKLEFIMVNLEDTTKGWSF